MTSLPKGIVSLGKRSWLQCPMGARASPVAQRHMGSMLTYGALGISRPSPTELNVVGASALSFLNTLLAHVCPATRSATFQRSDASVAFGADKVLWPCQRMLPLRAIFTDVFKAGTFVGAKMACEIRCIRRGLVQGPHNGPWPHQAWHKMAWPLARCGLAEIRCIRRGTHLVRGMAQNGLASGSMWPD